MHNYLVIIGNGFDLAHDMKTGYSDFIKYLVDLQLQNPKLDSPLFRNIGGSFDYIIKSLKPRLSGPSPNWTANDDNFPNKFFKHLLREYASQNWCDIENLYFNSLQNIPSNEYENAAQLNTDFEVIKKYLEEYLDKQVKESSGKVIGAYSHFFKENRDNLIILNFNYTNTITRYYKGTGRNLIQIHGELFNADNPIIFGYAASQEESRSLINKDDNQLMFNIKKHCYKRTNNELRLNDFLDGKRYGDIGVIILGHSCGISDKLILNQILNNESVKEVRIFYHEKYNNYFNMQVNIDRIMNNDNNFKKLVNFQDSHRMPQLNDTKEQEQRFIEHIRNNISPKNQHIPQIRTTRM